MSLRTRLLAAIFLALLIGFTGGAGLAIWHATRTVHDELAASLASARRGLLATLAEAPSAADLRRLVAAYDGNRHVRATLRDVQGRTLVQSTPAEASAPPSWFLHLVSPTLPDVTQTAPGTGSVTLSVDPASEAGERWTEFSERVASFTVFAAAAALLCSLSLGRGLRPLTTLAQGFTRVGSGESGVRMAEDGPPEIAGLAASFNRMAASLQAAEAQNRRLSHQVATIAEEERTEIARDLHDDIGPLLFAITNFTVAIGRMVETGQLAQVPAQLRAIQDATAQLQQEVRDMLERLHGAPAAPADLEAALRDLIAFWRGVRPETDFSADIAVSQTPDAVRECLFRAAQEGVSNAVRHGRPRHVWVEAATRPDLAQLVVRDDGAGGEEGKGLGLAGMRARAASLGGRVEIARAPGWTVTVTVPLENAA